GLLTKNRLAALSESSLASLQAESSCLSFNANLEPFRGGNQGGSRAAFHGRMTCVDYHFQFGVRHRLAQLPCSQGRANHVVAPLNDGRRKSGERTDLLQHLLPIDKALIQY